MIRVVYSPPPHAAPAQRPPLVPHRLRNYAQGVRAWGPKSSSFSSLRSRSLLSRARGQPCPPARANCAGTRTADVAVQRISTEIAQARNADG